MRGLRWSVKQREFHDETPAQRGGDKSDGDSRLRLPRQNSVSLPVSHGSIATIIATSLHTSSSRADF